MSKLENFPEQTPETGLINDPEKIKALKKSLKKRFNNFSEEPGHEDYVEDKLLHTVRETPDEFIEKGIADEIN